MRQVLEEIAKGTSVTDSLLVPLMEAKHYDVADCVDALLEIINVAEPLQIDVAHEQQALDEELEYYRQCCEEVEKFSSGDDEPSISARAISEELQRQEEIEEERRAMEIQDREHFAQMRLDLETEWLHRLEDQKRELSSKQAALETERQKTLAKQVEAVTVTRSADFKFQVEEALKKRLAEKLKTVAEPPVAEKAETAAVAPVVVDTSVKVELTCPSQAEMGSKITVFWEYVSGSPSLSDWIGYYKKSRTEESNQYYTYQKTGGSEKGKLEIVVPSKLGICELRMFQNNDYKLIGRSRPIRVGNSVSLAASLPDQGAGINVCCTYSNKTVQQSSWDWVAIFEESQEDNRSYIMSGYVTTDSIHFDLLKPGRYVARYFQSGSGYSDLAESNVFLIQDRDELKVLTPPDQIIRNATVDVSWNIESTRPSSKDRVGLFRVGDAFNPLLPLAVQLTHCNTPSGTLKFFLSPGLAPGMVEFVFMSKGSGKALKKSAPFEIK